MNARSAISGLMHFLNLNLRDLNACFLELSTYQVHIHTRRPVVCINFIHSEHAYEHEGSGRGAKIPMGFPWDFLTFFYVLK